MSKIKPPIEIINNFLSDFQEFVTHNAHGYGAKEYNDYLQRVGSYRDELPMVFDLDSATRAAIAVKITSLMQELRIYKEFIESRLDDFSEASITKYSDCSVRLLDVKGILQERIDLTIPEKKDIDHISKKIKKAFANCERPTHKGYMMAFKIAKKVITNKMGVGKAFGHKAEAADKRLEYVDSRSKRVARSDKQAIGDYKHAYRVISKLFPDAMPDFIEEAREFANIKEIDLADITGE